MTALIQAEAIHKRYLMGKTELNVLRGASVSVNPGESVAVIGRSGAGKSTLLHVLGGLDRPDAGRVWVGGQDLYALSAGRRTAIRGTRLGFVFQSYHLLPEMDVIENVMLPALARAGWWAAAADVRARARDLLACVGLDDRAAHRPMELSGGEQQRVALARALVNDPEIVLADEPTGNLDGTTGGQVLDHLFTLTRAKGHALLLVTHSETTAARCDRVLRLEAGTLVG